MGTGAGDGVHVCAGWPACKTVPACLPAFWVHAQSLPMCAVPAALRCAVPRLSTLCPTPHRSNATSKTCVWKHCASAPASPPCPCPACSPAGSLAAPRCQQRPRGLPARPHRTAPPSAPVLQAAVTWCSQRCARCACLRCQGSPPARAQPLTSATERLLLRTSALLAAAAAAAAAAT